MVVESIEVLESSRDLMDVYFCPLNALYPVIEDRPSVTFLMEIQEQFMPEHFSEEREIRLQNAAKLPIKRRFLLDYWHPTTSANRSSNSINLFPSDAICFLLSKP